MSGNLATSTPFETSSVKEVSVGTAYADRQGTGRVWHYCLAGGSTLARGKLNVAATITANHTNMNFASAPAANATSVSVTLGGTAATADQYQDGWLVVQDGTGEGRAYPIEGHGAQTSTTGNLTVYLKEKIDTAGAVSEANVDLVENRYDSVVLSVADQVDPPVGVNNVSITNAYYGWQQTWGPCAVLMDETLGVGDMLTTGSSVTGAVEADDAAGEPLVGMMGPQAGVDTEYQLVYLQLDPVTN